GTSLTGDFFASVQIFGETNAGGVVTGGNDTITVADSTIAAGGDFFGFAVVEIVGDQNRATAGETSTIGGGNDKISVTNSTISTGGATLFGSIVSVGIIGDMNDALGFDPVTFAPGDASATIGGGNDTIDVKGTSFTASGPFTGGSA